MRSYAVLPAIAIALLPAAARAHEESGGDGEGGVPVPALLGGESVKPNRLWTNEPGAGPEFRERFVTEPGRVPFREPAHGVVSFQLRGEIQFRGLGYSDLPLTPRLGASPGEGASLGSRGRLVQWMRFKPVFQVSDWLRVVGEIDAPVGMVAGERTRHVSAAADDYAELAWYGVRPRQLFVEARSSVGLVRVGQQTAHWGMGLVANDGDHPSLFGDYRRGAVVERVLLATKPLGSASPLALALAGDLVFQDARASLLPDVPTGVTPSTEFGGPPAFVPGRDRALQAVAAVRWQQKRFELGLYGVYRSQIRRNRATDAASSFEEFLDLGILDAATKFTAPLPGRSAYLFGEAEAAFITGRTNVVRSIELVQAGMVERIRSWGGAARLGAVRVAGDRKNRWGDLVVTVELGYASGDADPYDGTSRRFTIDPNHNVGLVLFDHVLAWKTARSATIAQDPRVGFRPAPGLEFLPTEGGIAGASYLHPTIVVRPRRWFDLKGGLVIAQSTADVVDPVQAGARGRYANYDGGPSARRDLGIEFDAGADLRLAMKSGTVVQLGVEGGLLVPGGAFASATGTTVGTQFLVNSRLGVQF